jgi:hypothetical protein
MTKKVVFAFLAGWAVAILLSPRDVLGFFKPRAA